MLTCLEDDWNDDGIFIYKDALEEFRSIKCKSCGKEFKTDDRAKQLYLFDVEAMTAESYWLCEHCDEILATLESQGYCAYDAVLEGSDTAQSLLEEYWALTGFDPKKYRIK